MHRCLPLVLGVIALAGCCSQPQAISAQDKIAWANEAIDDQRVVKRRLLTADHVERAIERRLVVDERTTSAGFAIEVMSWPRIGSFSDDIPFFFTCVMTVTEASPPHDAVKILLDAVAASDLSARVLPPSHDADTWAIEGTLQREELENPDLSVLQP